MSVDTADLKSLSDAQLWQLAERYTLRLRRLTDLSLTGRKHPRNSRLGSDFSGYLPYRPGDDVRQVDWSVFARNRSLQVRRYDDESSGRLILLLDASGSMDLGRPNKWIWTRTVALIIAFIALRQSHQVVIGVTADERVRWLPPQHGVVATAEISKFLRAQKPMGQAQLSAAMAGLDSSLRRGQLLVISDFLTSVSAGEDLRKLKLAGLSPHLIRVQSAGEFHLSGEGAADPEGRGRILYTTSMVGEFPEMLRTFVSEIEEAARAMDAPLLTATTNEDLPSHIAEVVKALSARSVGGIGRAP